MEIPFSIVFGKSTLDVDHIRPFGCRVQFCSPVKILKTLEPRTKIDVNLYQEGGGVYLIETGTDKVGTKAHIILRKKLRGKAQTSIEWKGIRNQLNQTQLWKYPSNITPCLPVLIISLSIWMQNTIPTVYQFQGGTKSITGITTMRKIMMQNKILVILNPQVQSIGRGYRS